MRHVELEVVTRGVLEVGVDVAGTQFLDRLLLAVEVQERHVHWVEVTLAGEAGPDTGPGFFAYFDLRKCYVVFYAAETEAML